MARTTGVGLVVVESGDPTLAIQQGMPTADSVDAAIARIQPSNLVEITALRNEVVAARDATLAAAAGVGAGGTPNIDDGTIT